MFYVLPYTLPTKADMHVALRSLLLGHVQRNWGSFPGYCVGADLSVDIAIFRLDGNRFFTIKTLQKLERTAAGTKRDAFGKMHPALLSRLLAGSVFGKWLRDSFKESGKLRENSEEIGGRWGAGMSDVGKIE